MSLEGKVYAVTGAASGIGLATAKKISESGGILSISDVDVKGLEAAEAYFTEKGVQFLAQKVDVSNKADVESWIQATVDKFGRLDGAANVAGYIGKDHGLKSVAQLDDQEWTRIMDINLTGTMYCMRAELNRISDGGSIVNVSSIHGTKGMPNYGAYAASKWGIIGLSQVAAKENGAREVRVNVVAPGSIYTPMMQKWWDANGVPADAPFNEPTAFQRLGKPHEVADVIIFLLGPNSTFISGSLQTVDGAWL